MTEYHYSQPRESKDREIEVTYLHTPREKNLNILKLFTGSEAPNLPSLPPEDALQGEATGRGRAYNPLSQTWRFHLVAFCINFRQDYTVQWFDIACTFVNYIFQRYLGTYHEIGLEGDVCLSGSIYRVRATERLNRGGALRWRETRVIPGRLPRQEHPSPFLDSQFAPCKAPRPHILPPPLVVGHNLPARVSSCEAKGSQQPPMSSNV